MTTRATSAASAEPAPARQAGTREATLLILVQLLPVLAIVSLSPALPSMLRHFAAVPQSGLLVAAALTMPGLCVALLGGVMGAAVDRIGRRPVLIVAMAAYGVFGMLPLVLDDLMHIIAARVGLGIAEAAIMAASVTLLSDYYEGAVRARWIAIQSAVLSIAATVLFLIGGLLTAIDWRAPFMLYAAAFPLLLLAFGGLWEPARAVVKATGAHNATPIDRRWFALVLIVTLLGTITFYVAPIQASVILGQRGLTDPAQAGLAGAIGTLGVPLGALFFKRYVLRWTVAALLALAFVTMGLGLIGMALMATPVPIVAAMLVNQFGCGLLLSALMHWMMSGLPPTARGRGNGWWTSAFFLGQFVSPIIVAAAGQALGGTAGGFVAVGIIACAVGIAWCRPIVRVRTTPTPMTRTNA